MVNVIIPTYKAKDTITDTLNSLCAQTKKMFIVTIVQDCDGEDYSSIIEEYRRRGLQIKHISLKNNVGPGIARQIGIESNIMCDYVMFVDADDMLQPRAVELLYHEAKSKDYDIVTSTIIQENKYKDDNYIESGSNLVTWLHGKIYKVSYLKQNKIEFIPCLRVNEDSYFNLIAFNFTDKIGAINESLYIWRDNRSSITRSVSNLDFLKLYGGKYAVSQIKAIEKILNESSILKPSTIALSILQIYYTTMRARYNNFKDFEQEYSDELKRLGEHPKIMDVLNTKDFWKLIYDECRCCDLNKVNDMFFYEERFIDWFKKYFSIPEKENSK